MDETNITNLFNFKVIQHHDMILMVYMFGS